MLAIIIPANKEEPPAPPVPSVVRQTDHPPAEPTEAEMRALAQARYDAINQAGGIRIIASGVQSRAILLHLVDYRKLGCKPYTRAFRCEASVSLSYSVPEAPDLAPPPETLNESQRYSRNSSGQWQSD